MTAAAPVSDSALFQPVRLGPYSLANRMVMAPLTRSRAGAGDVPTELMAEYYAQRASAGLIVSEAAPISPQGKGYAWTPGIFSDAQVLGWRRITDAVHGKGGRIFLQMWHVGRISHPSLQPDGGLPVAPSAVTPAGQAFTETGFQPMVTPRALELAELPGVVEQYRSAAANAREAGFDGVEIHAANGYLLDQFLRDKTNKRSDAYGGSIANRSRLLLEATEAVCGVWGADRVGIRLSPQSPVNDIDDSDPEALFTHVVGALNRFGLAYLHMVEGIIRDANPAPDSFDIGILRRLFKGPYMANNCYDRAKALAAISSGAADLIAFGRPFISNPDLVERMEKGLALTPPDFSSFYTPGAKGYTDYPPASRPTVLA